MADFAIDDAIATGIQLALIGKHADAIGMFRAVLIHEPDNFDATLRLGVSLFELTRIYEAFYWLWRARRLEPKNSMALMNYGLCLSQLDRPEEGLPDIERAVALAEKNKESAPILAMSYNNLGNTYERLGRYKQALDALEKGIALDPEDDFPHYNRGIALLRLNRQREAIGALERSLALKKISKEHSTSRLNDADAHYNLGMARLLLGDLKGGFADYESRLVTSENQEPNFGLPLDKKWHGQPLNGASLLIHGEQGLGDGIQMMRFLPKLRALGPSKIFIIEHSAIRPLLEHEPDVTVLKAGENIAGKFDLWVATMSLPYHLGIEREDQIPPPYRFPIATDRLGRCSEWLPDKPRVAICWAGYFRHKNDANRSIPLKDFAFLFDAPVNFVSVQQIRDEDMDLATDLRAKHKNLTVLYLDDFRDTAAVLYQCDLVVSVDTSVAHLAATLGVPTWILIPRFGTDWRWQLERTDSPWYPSVRLVRQERAGDWKPILARLKHELETALMDSAAVA